MQAQRVDVAEAKSVLMPIALSAESAGSTAMLMAVLISMVSTTAFYRFPDEPGHRGPPSGYYEHVSYQ